MQESKTNDNYFNIDLTITDLDNIVSIDIVSTKSDSVNIIDNYLDKNKLEPIIEQVEPVQEAKNPLYNSDIFFNCFNEEVMINNVVSCKEADTKTTNVDYLSSDDQDYTVMEEADDVNDNIVLNKNKYKKQKIIHRIGAVAISTFVLMGSALISRIDNF